MSLPEKKPPNFREIGVELGKSYLERQANPAIVAELASGNLTGAQKEEIKSGVFPGSLFDPDTGLIDQRIAKSLLELLKPLKDYDNFGKIGKSFVSQVKERLGLARYRDIANSQGRSTLFPAELRASDFCPALVRSHLVSPKSTQHILRDALDQAIMALERHPGNLDEAEILTTMLNNWIKLQKHEPKHEPKLAGKH